MNALVEEVFFLTNVSGILLSMCFGTMIVLLEDVSFNREVFMTPKNSQLPNIYTPKTFHI